MKNIVALALAATLIATPLVAATPSFAVDKSISALCGEDGPEAYKRPGGYCDQIGANDSLNDTTSRDWWYYWSKYF